ncbi:Uncharacterized conserved protein YbjQ, UPF0145 family [Tistlia consotensis]|uniref:UPF0145 protein SAMN05428998_104270 n=1 Tax=Tistlia consotensis USBA 355 TaxID=560819 RepID=A0A1Y6BM57_9PROT|nr:heavy metal-binding domain-containing protein [Tistlia consotensis]SMF09751.1 Uncharacterized conserved protein YbjQ, UPF0145 family [Tistlia consotensis USBA 355]SNR34270.1 Uncharacterized conserved protein YbjQ, UPF0145 family [Tistlia consotensis]
MLVTTTDTVEGRPVREYLGIVSGDAVIGANIFRDFFASITDIIGGRSGAYEKSLREAKEAAIEDMIREAERLGADAVVGVDLDYEAVGKDTSMLMVGANGTAVRLG